MKLYAEAKWAAVDESGWVVAPGDLETLARAKALWPEIKTRDDAANLEVRELLRSCTVAWFSFGNILQDDTREAWFDGRDYFELDFEDDVIQGTNVVVSGVSFAESEMNSEMGENYELIPSIRASCVFDFPVSRTREELEAINSRTELEPLHWVINFEIAGVWLGFAQSMHLSVEIGEGEHFVLRG
jgi:hypothetical protein